MDSPRSREETVNLLLQLTEAEALIITDMPQELRVSEITFLAQQDLGTRNIWVDLPQHIRNAAAEQRMRVIVQEQGLTQQQGEGR